MLCSIMHTSEHMSTRNQERGIGCQMALAALVVVCLAGIPPIVDSVAESLAQFQANAARVAFACGVCGVVETVREVTLGEFKHKVSTVSGEGIAIFLGMLNGRLSNAPVKIYEVAVRLQDGSMRVLREGTPPSWKPGDHVKVMAGRIKPVS
jgi:hypothetical protein